MPRKWHKRGLVSPLPDRQGAVARVVMAVYAAALMVVFLVQGWSSVSPPTLPPTGLLPPVGMLVFCQQHQAQCRPDSTAEVRWTPQLQHTLQLANRQINQAIRPQADQGHDVWSIDVAAGDCEDYALTKRAALIREGIPAGALRMAVTRYKGEGHAVLVVKTTDGDLVLDNLHARVMPLRKSGYRITMMASANPHIWTETADTPSATTTAASNSGTGAFGSE